jgi:serine protease Do
MSIQSFIRKPVVAALLGATVAMVPVAALLAARSASPEDAEAGAAAPRAAATVGAPAVTLPGAQAPTDFRALVRRYGPAVVNVSVQQDGRAAARRGLPPGMDEDDPRFRHFGLPMIPEGAPAVRGEGSGFIVSADGVILTNAHVVDGADRVTVKLTDRREFEARVLGADAKSDVAVLKIDAADLPAVKIGEPSSLEVGEWVVAIGAPFGFENSVTAGIVSAKGRTLPDDGYVPFIQSDVAVNPGNSGGPLFNLRGEVVGINSQIYSRSGGYQGVSFAIPIDVAMDVSRQLQANGHVTRGRIGVGIQELDQALAKSFGLDRPRGGHSAGRRRALGQRPTRAQRGGPDPVLRRPCSGFRGCPARGSCRREAGRGGRTRGVARPRVAQAERQARRGRGRRSRSRRWRACARTPRVARAASEPG